MFDILLGRSSFSDSQPNRFYTLAENPGPALHPHGSAAGGCGGARVGGGGTAGMTARGKGPFHMNTSAAMASLVRRKIS